MQYGDDKAQQKIFKCWCYCLRNTKLVKEFNATTASFNIRNDKNRGKIKATKDRLCIHAMASMDGSRGKGIEMNEIIDVNAPVFGHGSYHDSKDSKSKGIEMTDTDKRREIVSDITPMPRESITITNTKFPHNQYPSDDIKEEQDPDASVVQDGGNSHSNSNSTTIDGSNERDSGGGGSINTAPVLAIAVFKSIR